MENIALQGPHTYNLYVHYIVLVWRQQNFAIYQFMAISYFFKSRLRMREMQSERF
jgi:hypothetical protein